MAGHLEVYQQLVLKYYLHRITRWSILHAYTTHVYLENTLIKQTSLDSKSFSTSMHSLSGPRSVLIVDNCSTHQNEVFQSYFHIKSVLLLIYLACATAL